MSFAGLKKQINKANQYVSERVGTAEATKLDDDYHEMERKVDITNELVEDLLTKTREYLQPNPATRAKMATVSTIAKLKGSSKTMPYPQQEGILGESMLKYGKVLEPSQFGGALMDAGESFKQMADIKYALEDAVKQNFLDPLTLLQANDLKEVFHHRKKLQGRRLDYDCKRRRQVKDQRAHDEEMRMAEEKLEESKKLAETAMFNVLENDVEQISQLSAFVDAQLDFHRQTAQILESLADKLKVRIQDAGSRSRKQHIPKPVVVERSPGSRSPAPDSPQIGGVSKTASISSSGGGNSQDPWSSAGHDSLSGHQAPPAYSAGSRVGFTNGAASVQKPCCKALYDFDAENEGELSFKEGQIINLIAQIDENWFEGSLPSGQAGVFPISYVTVVVPL